ncbi:MAG TPA: hypothetical protein VJ124_06175 [Pyrinomonadaceae bacterium]|nr:hypothetical protein [Pyrinomonadaceae bacterium]
MPSAIAALIQSRIERGPADEFIFAGASIPYDNTVPVAALAAGQSQAELWAQE